METQVVMTTASRQEVTAFIRSLPGRIVGTHQDIERIGDSFRSRLAHSFFSQVAGEFDRLGRGQAGDDGRRWPPNSPKYLAYGKGPDSTRRGPGQMPQNRLGGPPAHGGRLGRAPGTGYLGKQELTDWWAVYMPIRNRLLKAGYPVRWAKAIAASRAWIAIKKRGARTKLAILGNRRDQVLVDRGLLRRSLQPGFLSAVDYQPEQGQLNRHETGRLILGTKNRHARAHHEGLGNLPERRLWPNIVPDAWWEEMLDQCVDGLAIIAELFG